MPAPKSLSSAQKPVMTDGGTPKSLLRAVERGLVLRDLLAPVDDAVLRGKLALEVEERSATKNFWPRSREVTLLSMLMPSSTALMVLGRIPAAAASLLKRASQAGKLSVLRQFSFGGG